MKSKHTNFSNNVYPSICHCADGRCTHEIYSMRQYWICRKFLQLVHMGKTPSVNCPYYDSTKDIENFKKKRRKLA